MKILKLSELKVMASEVITDELFSELEYDYDCTLCYSCIYRFNSLCSNENISELDVIHLTDACVGVKI